MDNHRAENNPDRIWKLMKSVATSMFTTRNADRLTARPFHAFPDEDQGLIWYMTNRDGAAAKDIAADNRVFLTFADKGGGDYAAVEGEAMAVDDRVKIKDLWNPWAEAFWEGPEDPRIVLIVVHPGRAQYWDTPNAAAATFEMLAGLVTGQKPKLGVQGEAKLS